MLNQMLDKVVGSYPGSDAIVSGESRVNYQALRERILKLAKGLDSLGVSESNCVALILPNCPEFVVSFLRDRKTTCDRTSFKPSL